MKIMILLQTLLLSEFDVNIKNLRNNKAPGVSEIPKELLQNVNETYLMPCIIL